MNSPLYSGEQIKTLIPQRDPILSVDTLYTCEETGCTTGWTVPVENMFVTRGHLTAEGIIEHMAQSASAWLGYQTVVVRGEPVKAGYIGEVRDFQALNFPESGKTVMTQIKVISETMGITLVEAVTTVEGQPAATARMKITC